MKNWITLGHIRPLCHTKFGLLVYKSQGLYLLDRETYKLKEVCEFPIDDKRKSFCICRLGARAAHITAYCGIEVPGGALVAFNKGVYFIDLVNNLAKKEHQFSPGAMRRPLSFTEIKSIKGFDDCFIYGEYTPNNDDGSVAIYARTSNQWKKVLQFKQNTIKHIHSIVTDSYRNRVLILTGDSDEESAIWEAKDNFKVLRPILKGDQKYRACCAKSYEEGIMIVTDSPFDDNFIYMVYENEQDVCIKEITTLPGPTVFYTFVQDKIVFATDVEFDFKNIQGKRRYFTRKLGEGVKDRFAHVFSGNIQSGFKEIAKFEKDVWPMGIFGFGNVHFPNGEYKNRLFMQPLAVKKYDEKLIIMDL